MRVLTLCYEWPPVGGGGGRAAKEIAEALARRGHQVRVQTIRFNETPAREVVGKVDVHRTRGFRRRADQCTPFEMAGYLVSSAIPTLRHLIVFKPDLIHAHFAVPTGVLALASGGLSRQPYVITAHLGDVPGAIPEQTDALFRWLNPLIRPVWQQAAAIVAVSKFVGDLARTAYGREATIIPNGTSLSVRPDFPQLTSGIPRLIFVGRLNPQKNLHYLPPILAQIQDLPWELDLVGDGEERGSLEEAFTKAGLSGRVRFHGWLDQPAVEEKLRQAEIFILPSLVEGLSVSALEALKFGLLLVGSDIPTLHECVTSGINGYLLSLQTPDQWIEKLRTLLSDPERRLAMRRSSWKIVERFDLEQIADRYEELFRQVVS
ncbi:MAG: glycosyltransferase family 4 protein, partial [Verrucomicrobia bacterium]|nr:glycosyltransferase family 4 protein [Verrucomicrobiota bacterium]